MISNRSAQERRRDPRLSNNIPLKIFHEEGDVVTQTVNISRSGAYCQLEKYIPPMTKFKVNLLLPIKKNGKNSSKRITCNGVVVRAEQVPSQNLYNIAIFFSDISSRDAESIADYVGAYLEQSRN